MEKLFFDNWESIVRTTVITVLAYISLIMLLRISGKRTLSKMNAFDSIVTIALGSTLASVLLNKDVALADGVLALTLLIGLQYLISTWAFHSNTISDLVKAKPTLLVYKGEFLKAAMRKERVNEDEIYAVVREKGLSKLSEVAVIIMETDGSLTVIRQIDEIQTDALRKVKRPSGLS